MWREFSTFKVLCRQAGQDICIKQISDPSSCVQPGLLKFAGLRRARTQYKKCTGLTFHAEVWGNPHR